MMAETPHETIKELTRPLRAPRAPMTADEQMDNLATEMQSAILLFDDERPTNTAAAGIDNIKQAANATTHPRISLLVALFRKFSDIAHQMRDENREKINNLGLIAEFPSLYEVQEEKKLVGFEALKTNVFWVRTACAMLCFVSFVLMSMVNYINYAEFNPSWEFTPDCVVYGGKYFTGSFEFWPYQLLLATGVIVYFYSTIIAIYYILPVDENSNKTIPGLAGCLARYCRSSSGGSDDVTQTTHWIRGLFSLLSKALQASVDAAATVLMLGVALTASSYLSTAVPFHSKSYPVALYFTINSFYSTYYNTHPQCVLDNPTTKLGLSIGVFYLAILAQLLCFQVSYSAYKHQVNTRHAPLSASNGDGSVRNEMRSLPLSTVDEDDDEDTAQV